MVDLNHAFRQFEMDEESKYLFVFYGPDGRLFRYNRLVMGTSSASSECHEGIRRIVEGLEGVQQIKDDIVVHGKGMEHDRKLEALFQRFQEYNITLRRAKCQLGMPQVKWFKHIYSKQGMSADPAKVEMIQAWPQPTDKSEVKSFLQTVQFCQETKTDRRTTNLCRYYPSFALSHNQKHKIQMDTRMRGQLPTIEGAFDIRQE